MQFLFSYYYDADISFSFSQSRILLDSFVKFYIFALLIMFSVSKTVV